ncbi:bifunctional serine/threonine-protein kinase/ABC transporter substrate-binding protein [Streptomyces cavourensis]|uniref:Bifunctional serine/threonine-protein kinase/ABC transporter substrate-binding protein n=1 Tax=Streptomyces cavourensis TaxID=67258 RepID=A0ABY5F5Q8_9ACTN|nr:bifunctional serine/threonine-protein kinase/ABC transporter substrate-binding protein [Streptomyces cavourensis]UTR79018.1 bifunctional serine/threonine-protein kinase/ABC transporter substrate-binding protein [Streptomyces cavourensis]
MRPLTSQDPRAVGPYRTLARLGAGGMGVVYLARSAGGALAAVKVIRAEHAADPRFRARFRREAEAAGRITGPWVVPVLGADSEAREPWLATAFVPGPSLGEAVGARGALPAATVRALGARLAAALATVHAGGLIHRDVKPGNILLALDGPRLIDFGIARHPGATALTATDAVLGTPGYLAPEQASAGPVGPACDVFSLGCVLVYAATGRPPFGAGGAAGVLFRTVHEEPDLDGVPPALLPLVTACLTKTPDARPTAGEVRDRLMGGAPGSPGAGGAGAVGGRDPREALAREPMPPALWALPGLPALIAERSAAALALPDPDPNPAPGPQVLLPDATPPDGAPPTPTPTRRRLLTAGAVGAVLLAGGSAAVWNTTRRRTGPSGALPTRTIGLHADLTGPGRATGLAHRRGAELAVADHNSRTGQAFRLALRIEDDAGEAARALRVADQLVADSRVMAVLGPTGDVLPEDVVLRYGKGRLTTVVVAAGVTTADSHANLPLCVTRPYDRNLGPALVSYLVHSRPAGRILLVQDAADPERGWQLGSSFRDATLTGVTLTEHPLPEGESGFGPAARRATAVRADAVVYAGGSPSRAARLAAALAAEGFTGTRVGAGPALGPAFLRGAGRAADGWVFAEAYADAAVLPSAEGFTAAHRRRFGAPPATWAAEAYDGVGLIARAAAATSAGGEGREGLAQRLVRTEHPGIVRTLAFSPSTRRVRYENGIFLYRVERGRPRFLGPYGEV